MKKSLFSLLFVIVASIVSAQNTVSAEELKVFAKKIDSLTQNGGWAEIDQFYFDEAGFADKISKQLNLNATDKAEFLEGLTDQGLFARIGLSVSGFEYLRTHKVKNEQRFICRVLLEEGTINYFDLIVEKKNNQLKIVDFYSFMFTDYYSNVMGNLLLAAFPDSEFEKASMKEFKNLQKMVKAKQTGDFAKAVELYKQLPEKLKQDKVSLGIRLSAAQQVSIEEYKDAIDDYYKYYPNEPGLNLLLIDRYIIDDDYEKALEAVDKTDSIVGGDVYLELYRANINTYLGNYLLSKNSFEKFLAKFPGYIDAYPVYVSILLVYDEYAKAIEVVKNCKENYNFDPLKELSQEDYPEFYASEEYKKYKAGK